MLSSDWSIVVFRCKAERVRDVLVELINFVVDLEGVKNLHFLIRDRLDDEVVFSFRILLEPECYEVIKSKIVFKLGTLISKDKFMVDPDIENPLVDYVAWSPKDRIAKDGLKKFTIFCSLLNQMSGIVVDMLEMDYFNSEERVEIAHVMSWMLGCTEYGSLSTKELQVGYYDRIMNKYFPYLKRSLKKS